MSAGLRVSTVTPGSTPPEASVTTPVNVACENAVPGTTTIAANARQALMKLRISDRPPEQWSRTTQVMRGKRRCRRSLIERRSPHARRRIQREAGVLSGAEYSDRVDAEHYLERGSTTRPTT